MAKKNSTPTFDLELSLQNQGYRFIIGIDESGRGPLAGPVCAAAVCIPDGFDTTGINDSKKLSSKKRELFYNRIIEECIYSYSMVDNNMIDAINILEATKLAMRQCIYKIPDADFALIDGNFVPKFIIIPAQAVIGGDRLSVSIAAASIVAKVVRDNWVLEAHKKYPMYGWDHNKGYGTKEHRAAIEKYGPCELHRRSFKLV